MKRIEQEKKQDDAAEGYLAWMGSASDGRLTKPPQGNDSCVGTGAPYSSCRSMFLEEEQMRGP